MIQTDMKAFKTSMKLIDALPYEGDITLRLNTNELSWSISTSTWRLVIPIEGSSSIQSTNIKLSYDAFVEIFKILRAVKKELKIKLNHQPNLLSFVIGEEVVCEVVPISVSVKESVVITNAKISSFKIDTMLSFLHSVYSDKSNVFTPMDKRVEISYSKDAITLSHTSAIKMTTIDCKNESQKTIMGSVIPVSDLLIVYSLFKNSMEFDGEIHDNDGAIIFATHRFKLGIKKQHEFLPSYTNLFQGKNRNTFEIGQGIMSQVYKIKNELKVLSEYLFQGTVTVLDEIKTKTTKADIVIDFESHEGNISINAYHYRSLKEIGAITKGNRSFYNFAQVMDTLHALSDTNPTAEIRDNFRLLLSTGCKCVKILILPMIPTETDDIKEESIED